MLFIARCLLFVAVGATFASAVPLLESRQSSGPEFPLPSVIEDKPAPEAPSQNTPSIPAFTPPPFSPLPLSETAPDIQVPTPVSNGIPTNALPTPAPSTFSAVLPSEQLSVSTPLTGIIGRISSMLPSLSATVSRTTVASPTDVSSSTAASSAPVSSSSDTSTSVKPTRTRSSHHRPNFAKPTTGPNEIYQYLAGHNGLRAATGVPLLTWSDDLASKAAEWASHCLFTQANGLFGPFGENSVAGTGVFTAASAIKKLADETYDPAHPTLNHLTQILWKSSAQLGCGVALCPDMFGRNFGPTTYHVCFYDPVGNVIGQELDNVQAPH